MNPRLADYIEAGKALDAEERLEAAHQLLLSVDSDSDSEPSALEAEWRETVSRRAHEVVGGQAPLVDGRESHARVRAEIAALRS